MMQFELKSSTYLTIYLTLLYLFAFFTVWTLGISLILKIILCLLISVYMFLTIKRYAMLTSARAIKNIRLMSTGQWLLCDTQNRLYLADLCGQTLRTPFLVILIFSVNDKPGTLAVPVLRDSLDKMVWLKMHFYLFSYKTLRNPPIVC